MEIVIGGGRGPLPSLIMQLTRSKRSHLALRYSGAESNWMVHSSIGGVQPEWWHYFEKKYDNIVRFECLFECADRAADIVIKEIGHKPYDYGALFGFGLFLLQNRIADATTSELRRKTNPLGIDSNFMCTEVGVRFLNTCNKLDPTLKLKKFVAELTAPIDIEEYLFNCKHFKYLGTLNPTCQ